MQLAVLQKTYIPLPINEPGVYFPVTNTLYTAFQIECFTTSKFS
jgi:hypothetical protein